MKKNQKQPFISVEKAVLKTVFKSYKKTLEQESHFNEISYLSSLQFYQKRDSNTEVLQCHPRHFSGQLLLSE